MIGPILLGVGGLLQLVAIIMGQVAAKQKAAEQVAAFESEITSMKKEAVKRGAARYNTDGKWEWVPMVEVKAEKP
jgi:hypothetical protein